MAVESSDEAKESLESLTELGSTSISDNIYL